MTSVPSHSTRARGCASNSSPDTTRWSIRLGDPRQTDETHRIRLDGLRYHYRIERPIRCGLPDRTPLNEGLIVETACGLTLNIGHVCGENSIEGLAQLVEIRTRTDAYDSDMRTIVNEPGSVRVEIERLAAAGADLDAARLDIADFLKPLSKYMRAAATDGQAPLVQG